MDDKYPDLPDLGEAQSLIYDISGRGQPKMEGQRMTPKALFTMYIMLGVHKYKERRYLVLEEASGIGKKIFGDKYRVTLSLAVKLENSSDKVTKVLETVDEDIVKEYRGIIDHLAQEFFEGDEQAKLRVRCLDEL